jgi:hypothetical protein
MVGSVNLRYCRTFFLFVYKDNLDKINSYHMLFSPVTYRIETTLFLKDKLQKCII